MLFNSPIFLFVFLPATVAAYIVVRQVAGPRAVLGLLLVASIFFYAWWNPLYVPLLLGLAVFNFVVARGITAYREAGRADRVSLLLTFGIVVDLMVLGYFKYSDFFIETANTLFQNNFVLQHILLPLGISFFMFQKIAYLVDASRGQVREHDLFEYCFFVMFFPQLLAGPITHHEVIFSQVRGPWAFAVKPSNFILGLTIFVVGLFKKVVLADNFAPFANDMFAAAAAGAPLDFFAAWQGLIAFKFQLYFDFSGYSEMALGAARLFGIQLPLNFNSPYRALNVTDYWRRWHMTLSRFLRDYLYIPLGGNRLGEQRRYLNLMLTMLLGGLWHGAGWNFFIWGGLHGLYLCANHVWQAWRGTAANSLVGKGYAKGLSTGFTTALSWAITFLAVVIAWVFFRARTAEGAWQMLGGLFGVAAGSSAYASPGILRLMDLPLLVGEQQLLLIGGGAVALALAVALGLPNVPQLFGYREYRRAPEPASLLRWRPNGAWALLSALALVISLFGMWQRLEFLYFQF